MKGFVVVLVAACFVGSFCAVKRETFVCRKGVPYMENQCNECYCIQENDLVCAGMKCPQNEGKGLERCATGSVWENGCNKCWCTNAGTICTNHECK